MEDGKTGRKGSYRDLKVYQISFKLSIVIHKATLEFPKTEQFNGVADQLRRSSKSICANVVEDHAKQFQSKVEFKRFVWMALGSADETRLWLEYARELGYISASVYEEWDVANDKLAGMLYRLTQAK